jgi:hypothetical protein
MLLTPLSASAETPQTARGRWGEGGEAVIG